MTLHKKGPANKPKTKGSTKNLTEVATTSSTSTAEASQSSSQNVTLESTEIVSSTSVVQEASKVVKSESRSNVVEVRSSSREVIMDSKGNVIKVIQHEPKTVKHSSSTTKSGQSSTDFIAGEQMQQIKQSKSVNIDDKRTKSSGKNSKQIQDVEKRTAARLVKDGNIEQSSTSHVESVQKSSSSSSTVIESSASVQDHSQQSSSIVSSDNIGQSTPVIETSSKSFENVRSSHVVQEGVTKDGQTITNKTDVQKAGHRFNDNGKVTSSKAESINSETTVTPASPGQSSKTEGSALNHPNDKGGPKNFQSSQNVKTTSSKISSEQPSDNKIVRTTVTDSNGKSVTATEQLRSDVTARNTKPGASTWDGKFVTERPVKQKPRNTSDSRVFHHSGQDSPSSKRLKDKRASVSRPIADHSKSITEVRQGSTIDQQRSSSTTEIHGSTHVAERHSSNTVIEEGGFNSDSYTMETINTYDSSGKLVSSVTRRVPSDVTFVDGEGRSVDERKATVIHERDSQDHSTFHSKPGDSAWDGKFIYEKPTLSQTRNTTIASVIQHTGEDGVTETTRHVQSKESSGDGAYHKESTSDVHIAEGSIGSSQFSSRERADNTRESYTYVDDGQIPRTTSDSPDGVRVSRSGQPNWNNQFVQENSQDKKVKPIIDVTVVRRTKPRNDSVEVQDITEEVNVRNVSESVSSSYIVEHSSSTDMKSIDKVTSVSETILEEEPSGREHIDQSPSGRPRSPDKIGGHPRDGVSVSIKPGQSTWDGHFTYEKPQTSAYDRRHPAGRSPQDSTTRKTNRRGNVIDIRDVTEDNSINEADIVTTSYMVEHSSSQQSFSDTKDFVSMSSITSENVYDVQSGSRPGTAQGTYPQDGRPVSSQGRPSTPQSRPGSPDKTLRPTKPGSSTWDGSFLYEKSPNQKKPTNTKKQPAVNDDEKPTDGRQRPVVETRRPSKYKPDEVVRKDSRHVSDTTLKIGDTTQNVSSTSEIVSGSFVVEESRTQESYADSKNLDFSTSSTETVIIRDGKPVDIQTFQSVTEQCRPGSPDNRGPSSREKIVDIPLNSSKRTVQPDDKAARPAKPGSSTWDGSFVIEKSPVLTNPADLKKEPIADSRKKPTDDRQQPGDDSKKPLRGSPPDGKPKDTVQKKPMNVSNSTNTTANTTKDVSSTTEVVTSSFVIGQSNVHESYNDSKNLNFSTSATETVITRDGKPVGRHTSHSVSDRSGSPDKKVPTNKGKNVGSPLSPDKTATHPDDKSTRPTKPGSSTWDGSFVIEKPSNQKMPTVDGRKKPTDERKQPIDEGKKSLDTRVSDGEPSDAVRTTSKHVSDTTLNIGNLTTDVSSTSEVVTSSFVVEQSSTKESFTDTKNTDFSTLSSETVIIRDGKPVERQTGHSTIDQHHPGSPDKKGPTFRDKIVDSTGSSDQKTHPDDKAARPTKPGSSTWDGSFVVEKIPKQDKPTESRKQPGVDDRRKPTDGRQQPSDDLKKPSGHLPSYKKPSDVGRKNSKHISDSTSSIGSTTTNLLSTSDIVTSSSFVVEQSSTQETYKDSKDVDFCTSSTETVIICDGKPVERQKVHSIDNQRRPDSPDKKGFLPRNKLHETGSPDKKDSHSEDRDRPTKPGSSTWDGSFVYEKTKDLTPKPGQRKEPIGGEKKPTDRHPQNQKPTGSVVQKSTTTSTNVRNTSDETDVLTSSYVVQQTTVNDSKKIGTSVVSEKIVYEGSDDRQPTDESRKSKKPEDVEKSPKGRPDKPGRHMDGKPLPEDEDDRGDSPENKSIRPTKPGSSTWNGAFTYEQPKKPQTTDKKPGHKKESTDDKKHPSHGKKKPIEKSLKDQKPTDTIVRESLTTSTGLRDVTENINDVSEITTSSYVEHTSVRDSETSDSSIVSQTVSRKGPEDQKPRDDNKKAQEPGHESKLPEGQPGRPSDKPEIEEKPISPHDKSIRPTKPGSSTWDGSFTIEKPNDRKKPEEIERKPTDDEKHPSTPKDVVPQRRSSEQRPDNIVQTTLTHDSTVDIRDVIDIQQSSYVIEHSSSFTSIKDVRDVTEEYAVTDYTNDIRQDLVSDYIRKFLFL